MLLNTRNYVCFTALMGPPFWSLQEPSRVTLKITTCSFFTGNMWGDHKQKHQGGVGLVGLPPVGSFIAEHDQQQPRFSLWKMTPPALMERRPRMFKNCVCTRIKSTSARFAIIFNKSCALCKGEANCFPCWIWFLTLNKRLPFVKPQPFYFSGQRNAHRAERQLSVHGQVPNCHLPVQLEISGRPSGEQWIFFPSFFHRMILSHTCTAQNQASGIHETEMLSD